MPQGGVMISGRYVSRNRPVVFVVLAIVNAVIAGINLGLGINYNCYDWDHWDNYCDYQRRAYIIAGSCFVFSSVCFLIAAISLHLKIKEALRRNATVLVQQENPASPEYVQQPHPVYPSMLVTQYPPPATPTSYLPPPTPTSYPPHDPNNPAPIGFAGYQQSVPPVASYPTKYSEQEQPPPYSP